MLIFLRKNKLLKRHHKRLRRTDNLQGRINKSVELDGNNGKSGLCLNWLITKYRVAVVHNRSLAYKHASVLLTFCHDGARVMECIWRFGTTKRGRKSG